MSQLSQALQTTQYRILIAGDNREVADPLRRHLADNGYDVKIATSGTALLNLGKEWPPNLILLDRGWSDVQGFEACNQLRSEYAERRIATILLCGIKDRSDPPVKIEYIDDYIDKPIDLHELDRRVERALEGAAHR